MQNDVLRQILAGAALAFLLSAAPAPAFAATDAESATKPADTFNASDINSFAGAYLAGRVADAEQDDKAAVAFYRRALAFEPDNVKIKERLMVTLFVQGDFDRGVKLAEELKHDPAVDRITAIARGVEAFRNHAYAKAGKLFSYDGDNDLDRLMNGLLTAWAEFGAGDEAKAEATIKGLKGPAWFNIFKAYSAGLLADAGGHIDDARSYYKAALTDATGAATAPDTFMRAVIALAEMEARAGNKSAALDAVATGEQFSPGYPPLDALRGAIEKGKLREQRLVSTAAQGAATVLFSIGSALNHQGAEEVVALYLHFASALDPDNAATRVMLGSIAEAMNRPEEAIRIYDGIPENSPMRRLSDMQRGLDLARIGKLDLARKQLGKLIDEDPDDTRSYLALGSVLSEAKDYAAMAALYDRAVKAIGPVPRKADWNIFFQRGIAYERLKKWPKAEPNFKQALALSPNRPQVLNYLGYSWIDRNIHLKDGLDMIKKATELKPNDGYIVDSLGWAYYKLGQFKQAVRELEHAVELKPGDPTINDHLGDAYWQVGRRIEAKYQWNRALTFKPDKDQIPLIEAKLKNGLPAPVDGRPVSVEAEMKDDAIPARAQTPPAESDKKSELQAPRRAWIAAALPVNGAAAAVRGPSRG